MAKWWVASIGQKEWNSSMWRNPECGLLKSVERRPQRRWRLEVRWLFDSMRCPQEV